MMREIYERDLNHSWMILEFSKVYQEDYQMYMLQKNEIPGLLEVRGQGTDEKSRYSYNITGKTSIRNAWSKQPWGYEQMENFVRQLIQVLYAVQNYLLDVNCLSLSPEHIYENDGKFYFCYCPFLAGDLWTNFHVLMEWFVKEMDYEDKEGIYLAYELHKATLEENYNIEQVLEQILERKEQEMEKMKPKRTEEMFQYDLEEESILDNWTTEDSRNVIAKERDSVWGFVTKRFHKRKKRQWEIEEGLRSWTAENDRS